MAATNLSHLIVPEILASETQIEFAKQFDFMFGGLAERAPIGAGETVKIRGFNELTGDEDVMSDGGSYATNNITTHQDIGVVLHRIKKFGAEDYGMITSGMDATTAIKMAIAKYFAKGVQNRFLDVLAGLFDASSGALRTSNRSAVYSDVVAGSLTSANKLNPGTAAAAMAKLGDNIFDLGFVMMHSATYASLLAAGYLETNSNPAAYGIANGEVRTFMGKRILVCDSCPSTAGSNSTMYRTFFVAANAFFLGVQKELNPEVMRDSNKLDIVSTDMHYCAHIRGVKWVGSANPTNVALATPANWELAADASKKVRVVAIDHNI